MDVLTDVLSSMRLSGEIFCRTDFTAPWGINVPAMHGAMFHVVDRGACWIKLTDSDEVIPLATGDLVVLPKSQDHDVLNTPDSPTVPILDLIELRGEDKYTLEYGNGGTLTTLICGLFTLQDGADSKLFSMLPPFIHIKGEEGRAVEWLETTLQFMASEAGSNRPGSRSIVSHLTEIIFIQAVRSWIDSHPDNAKGWLTALRDPHIGEAIGNIHKSPGLSWSVASLGESVGMSRSAFAAKFNELVGEPPLTYLTRWRMQVASNLLLDSNLSLDMISEKVGYKNEDPFKRAFKKHIGLPPGTYRRRGRVAHPITQYAYAGA